MKKLISYAFVFFIFLSTNVWALSSAASGSITADGTEQTLTTQTTAASYQLLFDAGNMDAADRIILRIYTKYASGGTSNLAFEAVYYGEQNRPIIQSIPVPVDTEIKITLEQDNGTNRTYYYDLIYGGTITSVGSGSITPTDTSWNTLDTIAILDES